MLERWRPGGASGVAAGAYNARSQAISNRAGAWGTQDHLYWDRRDAEMRAGGAAEKAGMMGLAAAGIGAVGSIVGGGLAGSGKGGPESSESGYTPGGVDAEERLRASAMDSPGYGYRPARYGGGGVESNLRASTGGRGSRGGGAAEAGRGGKEAGTPSGGRGGAAEGGGGGAQQTAQAVNMAREATAEFVQLSGSSQWWGGALEITGEMLQDAWR